MLRLVTMSRIISVIRRRPGIIELGLRPEPASVAPAINNVDFGLSGSWPERLVAGRSAGNSLNSVEPVVTAKADIATYDLYVASNFDDVFVPFKTVNRTGYRSASYPQVGFYDNQRKNVTCIRIVPSDLTDDFDFIEDHRPFWMKAVAKNSAGNVVTTSPLTLIIPYVSAPDASINIAGSVGTEVVDLAVPTIKSREVMVTGSDSIYVSWNPGNPEFLIPGLDIIGGASLNTWTTFNRMLVRGSADPTTFYMNAQLVNSLI